MKRSFINSIIFPSLILASTAAHAVIGSYDYHWPRQLEQYFEMVDQKTIGLNEESGAQCTPHYSEIAAKGTLDFRYALGYFDESGGYEMGKYGFSPSLDGIAFDVIRGFLTKPCPSISNRMSCGFTETGLPLSGQVMLTRAITFQGQPVNVQVTLTHASASGLFLDNLGELAAKQDFLVQQSNENFFGGLQVADIVFYNGHSRDGGGPDFKPPVLLQTTMKTNYAYYHAKREGFKNMMTALKTSKHQPALVGLFSCYSKKHFYAAMMKNNPKQAVVLTGDAIDYLNTLLASMGYMEAVLHGQCGEGLTRIAKQNHWVSGGFFDFNFK